MVSLNGQEIKFNHVDLNEDKEISNIQQYEIDLDSTEFLVNFRVRIIWEIAQVTIETSYHRKYVLGSESGEEKGDDINKGNNINSIIIAPFGCYGNVCQSLGVFYIDKDIILRKYRQIAQVSSVVFKIASNKYFTFGYFELRLQLKKRNKSREVCRQLRLPDQDKAILMTCSANDKIFYTIMKYCIPNKV